MIKVEKHFLLLLVLIFVICVIATNTSLALEQFIPNFESINKLMPMYKDQVINKLGKDFEIVPAGPENMEDGYCYKKYGITVIFMKEKNNIRILAVECEKNVDIKGARLGMSFSKIEKILGPGIKTDLEQVEPFQPKYALFYKTKNCMIWFGADSKEEPSTVLQIRRRLN